MKILFRIFGSGLVLFSCFMMGILAQMRMKRNWDLMKDMMNFLDFLEKEMIFHHTPLLEAMRKAEKEGFWELEPVIAAAISKMEKQKGSSFVVLWKEAAQEQLKPGEVPEKLREAVKETGNALCSEDAVMQKIRMEQHRSRIQEIAEETGKQYQKKAELYRRLSVTGGILLIILFQ